MVKKREGKEERLAKQEGITEYISVDEIINLPMGKFKKNRNLSKFINVFLR